jgi:hypothetical protein
MAAIPLKYMVEAMGKIQNGGKSDALILRGFIEKVNNVMRVYRYGTLILTIECLPHGWHVVYSKVTSVSDRDVLNSVFKILKMDYRATFSEKEGGGLESVA